MYEDSDLHEVCPSLIRIYIETYLCKKGSNHVQDIILLRATGTRVCARREHSAADPGPDPYWPEVSKSILPSEVGNYLLPAPG